MNGEHLLQIRQPDAGLHAHDHVARLVGDHPIERAKRDALGASRRRGTQVAFGAAAFGDETSLGLGRRAYQRDELGFARRRHGRRHGHLNVQEEACGGFGRARRIGREQG